MLHQARKILKQVFGYDAFRPFQEEVIRNVFDKKDTLAVMPTGGGKSLCYQIPALVFPGLTVVVSPLIALMRDQVVFLRELGVSAEFLNSSLEWDEYRAIMDRVRVGDLKLLYVAPETLLTERVGGLLEEVKIDCLAVDEAHCISHWGHDFRPEYGRLAHFRATRKDAVCLALTATATIRVRADILDGLGLKKPETIVASFDRPNIFLEVRPKKRPLEQLLDFVAQRPDESGIVYCFTRARTEELAAALRKRGHDALPYHAGLSDEVRNKNQERFVRDDTPIVTATIAFGMGIDKPNVRWVAHYDLPKSLESYYQEVGRAGRDGLPARGLLLYGYSDVLRLKSFLEEQGGVEAQAAEANLEAMVRYADAVSCRRAILLAHFGEIYAGGECGTCDVCLAKKNGVSFDSDVTEPAYKFLSCVKRTGERFGAAHVIDVLRGTMTEKVEKYGHDTLSTWGIGAEWDKGQWFDLARQLERQGFLARGEEYATLSLTPKAYTSFRDKGEIRGLAPEKAAGRKKRTKSAPLPDDEAGGELIVALRRGRKALADEHHVPPYVIFSDKTLLDLVARKPATEEELLEVFGMGRVKAARYGEAILAIVRRGGD